MTNPETVSDHVEIGFDWLPELKDGQVVFLVRLARGEQHSSFDISIDLARLPDPVLEKLKTILVRQQEKLSAAPEIAAAIRWLVELALIQQGLGPQERAARASALLLSDWAPSYKEQYFSETGKNFLRESCWEKDFIESTKELLPYNEVYPSWQTAVNIWTVQLPKGLSPSSQKEREELEIFFLKLRRGDSLSAAFTKHTALVDKWSSNQNFLTAMANTIKGRSTPDEQEVTLEHYLLCCWLEHCFWLLDNEDRAQLLRRVYGITEVSADAIRKLVKKLCLKDWSDFQPKGTPAPLCVQLFNEGEQTICQILPRSSGQP